MRPMLLHLSGPYRGRTDCFPKTRIIIGSTSDCDLAYSGEPTVAHHHAEIRFHEAGCDFYLKSIEGATFVNQVEVEEVILKADDVVEFGDGGPKVRFRVYYDPGSVCKPVRVMLKDATDVGRASGMWAATRTISRDLFSHATLSLKIGFPILVVALFFIAAYIGGEFGGRRAEEKAAERRRNENIIRDNELAELKREIEEFKRREAGQASKSEVDRLRAELAGHARVVGDLTDRHKALKVVLDEKSRGVCLLHGIFGLKIEVAGKLEAVRDKDGDPLEIEYFGSGFRVAADAIVTNHHVAEPWWKDDTVGPMIKRGVKAGFIRLDACFPGKAPIPVDVDRILLAEDDVDVAILRAVIPDDVPTLELYEGDVAPIRGEAIVLVGYPTGINAVMARAEEKIIDAAIAASDSTTALVRELAARNVIWPVITRGSLNEVSATRLVYDAETTSGGSGGPVFGPNGQVVGVNFAITRDFDGSNFGVPIAYAAALLAKVKAEK